MESQNLNVQKFNTILSAFRIKANCINHYSINNCSFYELKLDPMTKIKDIEKFSNEITLALQETTTPNFNLLLDKGILRLEYIKASSKKMDFFEQSNNKCPPEDCIIPVLLGNDIYGNDIWMDMHQNPHLLVAGCTGSGKSVALHNIIANILKYSEAEIYLVDPKTIEFFKYESIPNVKVIYNYEDTLSLIEKLERTMEYRFEMIKSGMKINDMDPIALIIDEFSDLSLQDNEKLLYKKLCKLAQKCRAAKIHIILSTQRPSAKLLDGNIKANFPARLSCKVSSAIDSKIIIEESGAEKLLGKGDAILKNYQHDKIRLQICNINSDQVLNEFGRNN